jgi:hypothetical protein
MKLWNPNKAKHFALQLFFVSLTSAPAFAACLDLTKGNSFTLIRNNPYFKVINTISNDRTVTETRVTKRDGKTQRVTTTYWNGLIAVDRKSGSSHIQLKMSEDVKSANLNEIRKTYEYPVSILVNGNEIDRGSFVIKTIKKTNLTIDGCKYPVMVVRKSTQQDKGTPINEEALFSLDAGMLLGNVAMTADWKAKTGVFYDKIEAE